MKIEDLELIKLMINFTAEELIEIGKNETDFKWVFDNKNVNLIPVLELYRNDKLYETIEATEFSITLQNLLKEIHELNNFIIQEFGPESYDNFLDLLKEQNSKCGEYELNEVCILVKLEKMMME
ncbi:hypothetical protein LCGC14_2015530, partial [marine sediment metagenome]